MRWEERGREDGRGGDGPLDLQSASSF